MNILTIWLAPHHVFICMELCVNFITSSSAWSFAWTLSRLHLYVALRELYHVFICMKLCVNFITSSSVRSFVWTSSRLYLHVALCELHHCIFWYSSHIPPETTNLSTISLWWRWAVPSASFKTTFNQLQEITYSQNNNLLSEPALYIIGLFMKVPLLASCKTSNFL